MLEKSDAKVSSQCRLFPFEAILLASFLGSFPGGFSLLTLNYRRLQEEDKVLTSLVLGSLVSLLFCLPLVFLPLAELVILCFFPPLVMALVVWSTQGKRLQEHKKSGGKAESLFPALCIALAWGAALAFLLALFRGIVRFLLAMMFSMSAPVDKVPQIVEGLDEVVDEQMNVRVLLEEGRNFYSQEEYEDAYVRFEKAADLGSPEAAYFLGILFAHGRGVQSDLEQAWHHVLRAAKGGYGAAQNFVGQSYYMGQQVGQDFAQAKHWLNLAAKNGQVEAWYFLGLMHKNGQGFAQSQEMALTFFQSASLFGNVPSLLELGKHHQENSDNAKDRLYAHTYFSLARIFGAADLESVIDKLEKHMNPQEIEQAQKMAQEWMNIHELGQGR